MLDTGKGTGAALVVAVLLFSAAATAGGGEEPRSLEDHDQAAAGAPVVVSWDFEDVPVGELPTGWQVEATNRRGPLATWQVVEDETGPVGGRVLALTSVNHSSGGTFNICWTDSTSFLDGEIRVRFKAVKGREDQGGGVIWRVQDQDNYYIARFNPLEDNFRLYTVHEGARRKIADARIALPAGQWHTMRIVQQGDRFAGYLDGKKLLEGKNDLFQGAGGVGVWTKADAVTSFDGFSVKTGSE